MQFDRDDQQNHSSAAERLKCITASHSKSFVIDRGDRCDSISDQRAIGVNTPREAFKLGTQPSELEADC